MKVLVTGAAGYIGSILTPALLREGHDVIAVDNFVYGQNTLLECCHERRFTMVRGDVRDKRIIQPLVAKADVIIPLACLVGAPLCDRKPDEATAINRDAVLMVVESSSRNQAVIWPCTNSGYGVGQDGIHCTEETPMRPVSHYGRLKVEAEEVVLGCGHAVSLRLATVFGISPRMRLDLLVNDFTYRAVTDRFIVLFEAHFKRNYIHVRDVTRAFMHVMANFSDMANKPFNVGLSDANISKMELCQEIRKQVPSFCIMEAPIGKDPDQRNYIVSNARIEATGYRPQVSLQEGIAELIKGYQIVSRNQYGNI